MSTQSWIRIFNERRLKKYQMKFILRSVRQPSEAGNFSGETSGKQKMRLSLRKSANSMRISWSPPIE